MDVFLKDYAMFIKLNLSPVSCVECHLVPLEQCIEEDHGKNAVVMPMYLCAVGTAPYFPVEIGLAALHSRGVVHNDFNQRLF